MTNAERCRVYYQANRERLLAQQRVYNQGRAEALKAYKQAWAAKNRERIAAQKAAKYRERREELSAKRKEMYRQSPDEAKRRSLAYHHANRERCNERSRAWRDEHAAEISAARCRKGKNADEVECERETDRAWWARNGHKYREYRRTYDREYRTRFPEKKAQREAKRRALKRDSAIGEVNYALVLQQSGGVCGICRLPLDSADVHFDHIVPLARGGAHTQANMQATHPSCNLRKGARVVWQ